MVQIYKKIDLYAIFPVYFVEFLWKFLLEKRKPNYF